MTINLLTVFIVINCILVILSILGIMSDVDLLGPICGFAFLLAAINVVGYAAAYTLTTNNGEYYEEVETHELASISAYNTSHRTRGGSYVKRHITYETKDGYSATDDYDLSSVETHVLVNDENYENMYVRARFGYILDLGFIKLDNGSLSAKDYYFVDQETYEILTDRHTTTFE